MSDLLLRHQAVSNAVSAQRRTLAAASPEAFARVYLPNHMRVEPPAFHRELYSLLHEATQNRRARIAVAAPRGYAKSTVVSLAYVLWSVLYGHERLVLLVSATRDQAVQHLKNVKDEIQTNPRLLADFPTICHRPGARAATKPWRDNRIALSNGVMIRALGAEQQLRGMKHGAYRPSLIIADDLESQELCISAEQRQKLRDWFEKTLLKAGDERTNFIVVGTIVHYDALLAGLTHPVPAPGKGVGWQKRKYQAVLNWSDQAGLWEKWEAIRFGQASHEDEIGPEASQRFFAANRDAMLQGTHVLWPERESYLDLMQMRADEGRLSFLSEKQNEPLDNEQCLFDMEKFRYWDDQHETAQDLLRSLGSRVRILGACDPSLGIRTPRGDYTAIITLAYDEKLKMMYVLEADLARRKPDQTLERIVSLAKVYKYNEFAFEANQFQDVLADQLQERLRQAGVFIRPKKVTHTNHKQTRIESLEPLITSGTLRFSRRHSLLLEQLRQFPLGAHDDGPDALEMAVEMARRPQHFTILEVI